MRRFILTAVFVVAVVASRTSAKHIMKIVGGMDTYDGEFPYQVSLKLNGSHHCGGCLISNRHVLTAAHCVHGIKHPYDSLKVVTGTKSIVKGGESHKIEKIVINKKYEPSISKSFKNDIAVIILKAPCKINKLQQPIEIATSDPPVGAVLTVSGWGAVNTTGPLSANLKKSNVYLISNEVCQLSLHSYPIYSEHMCTLLQKGVGECIGDSGSPLVYEGKLVGTASWVIPCAQGYPDVYTRVTQQLEFINKVVLQ